MAIRFLLSSSLLVFSMKAKKSRASSGSSDGTSVDIAEVVVISAAFDRFWEAGSSEDVTRAVSGLVEDLDRRRSFSKSMLAADI
jgi:hypothetical protein